MTVAVVGSLNIDLVVSVDRLPRPGETVVGSSSESVPGGKGANQAAAAGSLSGNVTMIGRVGDDARGQAAVRDLIMRGVDVSGLLRTPGSTTGSATVAVDPAGENLIVVAPGANASLSPDDVRVDTLRDAAVVLVQLEIALDTVLACASSATGLVVLNPAPPGELPAALLDRVDVLVPNEWELAALADSAGTRHEFRALESFARQVTARDVVVTMGARGTLVVPGSDDAVVIAPLSVAAIDTTGAGDCFCGALAVALSRGDSLVKAARYANAAAAMSTTGRGARGALPTDAVVRRALG